MWLSGASSAPFGRIPRLRDASDRLPGASIRQSTPLASPARARSKQKEVVGGRGRKTRSRGGYVSPGAGFSLPPAPGNVGGRPSPRTRVVRCDRSHAVTHIDPIPSAPHARCGRFAAPVTTRTARRTTSAPSRPVRPLASTHRPPRPRLPDGIGSYEPGSCRSSPWRAAQTPTNQSALPRISTGARSTYGLDLAPPVDTARVPGYGVSARWIRLFALPRSAPGY